MRIAIFYTRLDGQVYVIYTQWGQKLNEATLDFSYFLGLLFCFAEGPHLTRILELERNHVTQNSRWDSRGSPNNTKIPHLHVPKPIIAIVGSAVVKTL